MRVHLYTQCWNEADMLGFFFRHYDLWVERYVVFDDGSSDGSAELLDAHPRVERRRFERGKSGFVLSHRAMQNEVWKESRGEADWVVVTAIDEHLWSPGGSVRALLGRYTREGVTVVPALGYQMLSEQFPDPGEHLSETRTIGAPYVLMSKLSVLNPDAIDESGFGGGRHMARPSGDVVYPERDELLLLHYKYLGFERLVRRHAMLRTGLGRVDKLLGFGHEYRWDEARLRADWDGHASRAIDVAADGHDAHSSHPAERWWRPEAASEVVRPRA